jgi:hypothetical protein
MKISTVFLQIVIVLIGMGALTLLLWEPHLEGRNAHATIFEIYFKDPFLAYAYVASVPFFVALTQAFKVLGYAGQGKVFSSAAVKNLRIIKFCAIAIVWFVVGGLIAFSSLVIAAAAVVFERVLREAVEMKLGSE